MDVESRYAAIERGEARSGKKPWTKPRFRVSSKAEAVAKGRRPELWGDNQEPPADRFNDGYMDSLAASEPMTSRHDVGELASGDCGDCGDSWRFSGDDDLNIAPPVPTDDMFPGFVGEFARIASEGTEVNPIAAAAGLLSFLGAMAGRDLYHPVGDAFHHPREFWLHVGRSNRGRKGDSLALLRRVKSALSDYVEGSEPPLIGKVHEGGLSSREGLAFLIHDGFKEGKKDVPAIDDKRLWIVESEFANVLHQTKRDGNTLSAAMRDAWDGRTIAPAIKSTRVWASHPHIGLTAHITPSELHSLLEARELSNGFANRFLIFWAERTCLVPLPKTTRKEDVARLARTLADIVRWARGRYPKVWNGRRMEFTPDAEALYSREYRWLSRSEGSEMLSGILERKAAHCRRLAMLFAIQDRSQSITEDHLRSALAWVRYCAESVRFVFAEKTALDRSGRVEVVARKALGFLRGRPDGATRTEIVNECFGKHSPAGLDEALRLMMTSAPPRIRMEVFGTTKRGKRYFPTMRADFADYADYSTTARV